MKPYFADTFFYMALLNPNDRNHDTALRWRRDNISKIVTTEFVLIELGNAMSDHRDKPLFIMFDREIRSSHDTMVITASSLLLRQGLDLFAARRDKDWSLVDCTSFVVMKKRGLTNALTGDHHFEQAGFNALWARS